MPSGPRKLDQVVDAAVAEFQDVGFTAAHMDRIAERAVVSKRTLYNYFESKDALFLEILKRASSYLEPVVSVPFDPSADVGEQLHAMAIRQMAPYGDAQNVKLTRLIMGEWLRNPDLVAGLVAQIERTTEAREFFKQASDAGYITAAKADDLANNVMGFIKGRCMWPALLSGKPPSKADIEAIAQMICDLFEPHFR